MSNVTLGMMNFADEATLSSGSWMTTLPITNMKNRRLSKVARSSNALAASTKFDIALTKARAIRVLSLIGHNLSVSATVRIYADDAADFVTPIYDSGSINVWPTGTIPQELLDWEGDNFWLGTISQSAVAGYQAPFISLMTTSVTAQYWRVVITDTTNPDGWVQIGRLYIADAWTPTVNMDYGTDLSFEDVSAFETSLTGEEFFEQRQKRRKFKFTLGSLSATEGWSYAMELERMAGTTGEVLAIADPADAVNAPRRNFLGRLVSLSGLANNKPNRMTKTFEIAEVL